jgi:antitoxin PrlF
MMNAQTKIDHVTVVNMTSKGQVLIPKELRDRKGLRPGEPVRVGENDRGETVILPAVQPDDETPQQRYERIKKAIASVRGSIDIGGLTTDEYMREIRGDWEP